ncbi:methyltransferase domain-containing protein [Rhodococcus sp. D2-41]|uniref:HemK2/MTQ2 family protein methyltransferase n=1 Tax=Speluncibacter jeojiensis TaxID=2710754 RepID=UPI00240F847C|nr:HemK2/MTQ2 family protein methyltransferase [Rhodococcus sp. D2-41]MDG3010847.1 methyltransferase domain-containing protein [Rhodococcus sp. D2-41]
MHAPTVHRVRDAVRTRPIVCFPGVYPPQEDTALLADAIGSLGLDPGFSALDICTGSGALAIAAARAGAGHVVAVDRSRMALFNARINARRSGVDFRVRRADLRSLDDHRGTFDLVVSNPPYVPAAPGTDGKGCPPRHCWDGGRSGRRLLDPLCEAMPRLLCPGGTCLLVQSASADVDRTMTLLSAGALDARVVDTRRIPFGPVMTGQSASLWARGLVPTGCTEEEIVVVGARRPGRSAATV